ncbi:MAG: hypothetical protein HDR56_04595 [Treponema sp.]|nr:hypothetical protein [Treponema sp.]
MSDKKSISLTVKIKSFILSLIAYYSLLPYFFWARSYFLLVLSLFLFCIQISDYYSEWHFSKVVISYKSKFSLLMAFWTLLFTYIFIFKSDNLRTTVGNCVTLFYPLIVLLSMGKCEKRYAFNLFLNLFCITLFISLFFYFLVIFGFTLPHNKIYHPSFDGYAYFESYYFLIFVYDPRSAIFPRFQSVFTEPGHVGMYCAFFLFGNGYDKKDKRNWILIVVLIFSLSLAAYALLIIGFGIFVFMKSQHKTKICFVLLCISVCSFCSMRFYYENHSETVFSKWVLARVFNEKSSNIKIADSLQNRSSVKFKKEFAAQKENATDYLLGKGAKYFAEHIGAGTASAEVFIFQNGLLGIFFLSLFYLYVLCTNFSAVGFGLLCLYFLSFLQRPVALSFYQLFLFITLIPSLKRSYFSTKQTKRYFIS